MKHIYELKRNGSSSYRVVLGKDVKYFSKLKYGKDALKKAIEYRDKETADHYYAVEGRARRVNTFSNTGVLGVCEGFHFVKKTGLIRHYIVASIKKKVHGEMIKRAKQFSLNTYSRREAIMLATKARKGFEEEVELLFEEGYQKLNKKRRKLNANTNQKNK